MENQQFIQENQKRTETTAQKDFIHNELCENIIKNMLFANLTEADIKTTIKTNKQAFFEQIFLLFKPDEKYVIADEKFLVFKYLSQFWTNQEMEELMQANKKK